MTYQAVVSAPEPDRRTAVLGDGLPRVGVIGLGHVGRNIVDRLGRRGVEVVTYERLADQEYPHEALASCDFVYVCVGTPQGATGEADLTDVRDAVDRVPNQHVLVRSTVPPGSTDELARLTAKSVCFSPEYVGETAFSEDDWKGWAHDDSFQILGGPPEATRWFAARLAGIHGPQTRFFQCSAVEAEIVKYMENSYFALKVTFVNEFYDLCQALDADWFTVREGWLLDPRVERDHTAVFPSARGFGGRCLPKDLDAILKVAANSGTTMSLLDAAREVNGRYRPEGGDVPHGGDVAVAGTSGEQPGSD